MTLDPTLRERLWSSRYRKELEQQARKNAYLNDDGSAEDLFQDMSIHVWMNAVENFDPKRVTYKDTSSEQGMIESFNAFFHWKLKNFLANAAEHRDTVKQTEQREKTVRGDQSVGGDDDGEGSSLFEMLEGGTQGPVAENMDFQQMLHSLPPNLSGALSYIVNNLDADNQTEVWKNVRSQYGLTKNLLYNALMEEPEFLDFISEAPTSRFTE